jgi:hypothetical protein
MRTVHIESQVGNDGVLSLLVPLGPTEANAKVLVTIEPSPAAGANNSGRQSDWHEFVERTYGSCAGLGLEEPADLPLQTRESQS